MRIDWCLLSWVAVERESARVRFLVASALVLVPKKHVLPTSCVVACFFRRRNIVLPSCFRRFYKLTNDNV